MKAKLIKNTIGEYYIGVLHKNIPKWVYAAFDLSNGYYAIASSTNIDGVGGFPLLSLKNCQAIERGYDLDELGMEMYRKEKIANIHSFKVGFQKALEILGDRKSAVKDFLDTWFDVDDTLIGDPVWVDSQGLQVITPKRLNELYQQNEWEVEVEMEDIVGNLHETHYTNPTLSFPKQPIIYGERPKLDADGCLILKRVI